MQYIPLDENTGITCASVLLRTPSYLSLIGLMFGTVIILGRVSRGQVLYTVHGMPYLKIPQNDIGNIICSVCQ